VIGVTFPAVPYANACDPASPPRVLRASERIRAVVKRRVSNIMTLGACKCLGYIDLSHLACDHNSTTHLACAIRQCMYLCEVRIPIVARVTGFIHTQTPIPTISVGEVVEPIRFFVVAERACERLVHVLHDRVRVMCYPVLGMALEGTRSSPHQQTHPALHAAGGSRYTRSPRRSEQARSSRPRPLTAHGTC